jgi:hypothetical protein
MKAYRHRKVCKRETGRAAESREGGRFLASQVYRLLAGGSREQLGARSPSVSAGTISIWLGLSQALIFVLGLAVPSVGLAEQQDPKADDMSKREIEAEANLPIYHLPLKAIHPNIISKNQGETTLLTLQQPTAKSPLPLIMHRPSTSQGTKPELRKSTPTSSSDSNPLAKFDSLAQTQDKTRQRARYGFSNDDGTGAFPSRTVTPEAQRGSVEKPVSVYTPQNGVKKAMTLPNNAAIWTRNEAVPHRGPGPAFLGGPPITKSTGINRTRSLGPAFLGGPPSTKNTGINGTGMKTRP